MAAPTNIDAASATLISSLPYNIIQQVTDGGVCYTVWYKIVGIPGTLGISVTAANSNGAGSYVPDLSFYESDGVTPIIGTNLLNPIQVGTLAAVTYYIVIEPNVPDLSSALMELTVINNPTAPILASYILIPDDSNSFAPLPGVIYNPNTNEVINLVFPFAQGEGGDIFQSGVIVLEDFPNDGIVFYAPDFDVITSISLAPNFGFIAIRVNHFLNLVIVLADKGATSLIRTYNDAGVQQSTITAAFGGSESIALANDGTTMYYTSGGIVRRWNISLNSAMADFMAAVGTYTLSDILVLDNDDVLVLYPSNSSGGNVLVIRYNSAGVLQQTYDLGAPSFVFNPSGAIPRMGYDANGGQTAFWVYWFPVAGISRASKIQISDGAVLLESNINAQQVGEFTLPNPSVNFGPSLSCPIIILGDNNVFTTPGNNTDGTLFVTGSPPGPNASGLYEMIIGKTNDTIWVDVSLGTQTDVPIP